MNGNHDHLKQKILSGARISPEEGLSLFRWDLHELGRAADFRRTLAHPGDTVGFIIDRIVNFTNICEAGCAFCAYHARAGAVEPYEMSDDEIFSRIDELVAAGGTQVMLQGGLHPEYSLERYVSMIQKVKKRFPSICLHSLSPAETVHIARKGNFMVDEVIGALKRAGLDSMPGASDLLVDRIRRKVSPRKLTVEEWREVMRSLARNGLKSSATMTYGMGETPEERIQHLETVRSIQDETGIIRAFIPWSFSPARTALSHLAPATGLDYLKIVAVARIYLDNIPNIQAGWLTEGLKLAQIALAMGANDMGGVLTEEVVVKATGIGTRTHRDELIDIIKRAGRTPVERDSDYRVIRSYADGQHAI